MIKHSIKSTIPSFFIQTFFPLIMKRMASRRGLSLDLHDSFMEVVKKDKVVRISRKHAIYLNDIFKSFNYYHEAVMPIIINDLSIVDYSGPRYHDVVGFDLLPIMFPSFAEPMATTLQYLSFAGLCPGMTAIDLGAYSGLTSIVFSQEVGQRGMVIAVDADPINLQCIHRNIQRYNRFNNSSVRVMEGAVWSNSNGTEFSCEGNMGGAVSVIVGRNRGRLKKVQTFTLSDIVKQNKVTRVDFIKCDIEGAESFIFEDKEFFNSFRPRIIVEPHLINGRLTSDKVMADLESYGYKCHSIKQEGVDLPLIECIP